MHALHENDEPVGVRSKPNAQVQFCTLEEAGGDTAFAGQREQVTLSPTAYVFIGQAEQYVAPTLGATKPRLQLAQVEAG
jgi:hypothetical protein